MRIDEVEDRLRESPERWLVTGGAGFIGSHLVQRLLTLEQDVVVLDDLSTGLRANLDPRAEFVQGDIRDPDAVSKAMTGANRVLHQAALGSVPRSMHDPVTSFEVNAMGLVRVLEAARSHGVRSIVYASSSSVYGGVAELPACERAALAPVSPYASSKAANEVVAHGWARAYGMRVIGLRYFNVCGVRQRPDGPYAAVIPRWISELRAGKTPTIFGDGETSRDFCAVDNVVQANLLAAFASDRCSGRVYNVAVGQVTTLNELFRAICEALGCAEVEPAYASFRAGDVRHSHADLAAIRADLGYEPTATLADAIRAVVEGS